ncbi:uncharacterized protein LOC122059304 [Macadamia integrifolia]|uniref:uncharacterized protein LOC122059304 n=1 Tax=Macadamia integrifolia TaxID=60698 RepID=UPI001C52F14A|nr:uncharacterized protein LOC122059304 [Macadamia integrifolia]
MMASQRWCSLSLLFFIFIFVIRPSTARPEKENPLLELSRAEFVEMAGYGEDKLSSVLVTGSVLCEVFVDGDSEPHTRPVSGATVEVKCNSIRQKMEADSTALTDKYGDFVVDLPSQLHAIPNLEKACTLSALDLPKTSPCNQVFVMMPIGIRLASIGNGIRTYTAETITFRQPQTSDLNKKKVLKK